jgi:hypothetical protein
MNRVETEKAPLSDNLASKDTVVEVTFLFDLSLLKTLEATARAQGMTLGGLVRYLLREFLILP